MNDCLEQNQEPYTRLHSRLCDEIKGVERYDKIALRHRLYYIGMQTILWTSVPNEKRPWAKSFYFPEVSTIRVHDHYKK